MANLSEIKMAETEAQEYFSKGDYQWAKMWFSNAKALAEDFGDEVMAETYFGKVLECERYLEERYKPNQFLQE